MIVIDRSSKGYAGMARALRVGQRFSDAMGNRYRFTGYGTVIGAGPGAGNLFQTVYVDPPGVGLAAVQGGGNPATAWKEFWTGVDFLGTNEAEWGGAQGIPEIQTVGSYLGQADTDYGGGYTTTNLVKAAMKWIPILQSDCNAIVLNSAWDNINGRSNARGDAYYAALMAFQKDLGQASAELQTASSQDNAAAGAGTAINSSVINSGSPTPLVITGPGVSPQTQAAAANIAAATTPNTILGLDPTTFTIGLVGVGVVGFLLFRKKKPASSPAPVAAT